MKLDEVKANKKWALNGGPFGSKLVSRDYTPDGVPVIRGTNLPEDARFSYDGFVFVSEEKADDLLANNAHPGDLVFTQRGTLGQVGLIPKDSPYPRFVISQSQMKLTVDEAKADAVFIYYIFRSPSTVKRIHNLAFSSGVPHINLDILRNFDVALPPLPVQRAVAGVLAAYDELIENNTRRIKLLEQMAQALYREWFVRPCQAGKLPKGWERKQIGDVATLLRGKSYRSEDLADDGSLPFLNLKCMERDGGFRHEGIKRFRGDYKDNHTAKAGDIVVAVTDMTQERRIVARAARVPRTHEPLYVMSMDLVRLAPKPGIPDAYLYAMLRYSKFPDEVKQHANGVNVLHLSPDRIAQFEFELPDKARREQFGEVAQSIFEQCDVLNLKNANLRRTRDLLLPKLISGEVSL